jgi:hypothetical protein
MFIADRLSDDRPAFRIYAFKSGAWPELILGAVMGAAGRIEAERRHQDRMKPSVEEVAEVRAEFEREVSAAAKPRRAGVDLSGLDNDLMVRRRTRKRPNIFKHRPGAAPEPRHTLTMGPALEERRREPGLRQTPAAGDKAFRQRFGSYAGLAEAELTTYRDAGDAPEPANSNTERPEADEAAVVVPFPAPVQAAAPRPATSFAERIATALAAEPFAEAAAGHPTIGVELRRETATFRVPVSEASLPEALMKLSGGTLQLEAEPAVPQLELSLAAPAAADAIEEAEAIALPDESNPQDFELADFEPPRVLRKMVD